MHAVAASVTAAAWERAGSYTSGGIPLNSSHKCITVRSRTIAEKQMSFLQAVGVKLTAEEAYAFACAAEHGVMNFTDIRGLANLAILRARKLADALVRQQPLEAIFDTHFQLAPAMMAGCRRDQLTGDTVGTSPEVTPEAKRMVSVLVGEMSRAETMAVLGLKDEKHFREHYQQNAISAGLIKMAIPDKPASRSQKYRLTALGETLLNNKK